jgi:predicted outer membrane repeat protein
MQPTAEFFYSSLSGNTIEIQNSIYEPIGADLFVSPSGSNENSGLSENEPLQTLAYALTVINSNSDNPRTIHLSEGVYSTETNENFPVFGKDFVSVIGVNPTNTIIDLGNIGRFMRINNVEQFKLENVQIINGNSYVYQHPESDDGGVIRSSNSDYDLINVTFSNNRASYGGAIYSIDSNVNIDKCNLHHNESNYSGGSIYMEGSFGSTSSLLISNSTFTSNLADGQGGAIFSEFSDVEVINTICWNNLPQELSVGSSFFDPSTLTVTNCDIMGGEANVEQYGENSTLNWLDNNIDIDPLFVDAENNNYLLQENSPCIDAGTAFFEWNDVILLDMGIEEYFGIAPDMGAFEYGMTSIEDEPELPMSNRKLTNYPNPFNPTTTISFSLTTNLHENVRIEIYNVKGQLVETLSNLPITNSPNQQIVWNANKFASGVYFYKLVVDGIAVDTKRMILLK